MKTLIIHPDDRSTDFLCPIYEGVTNPTIVRSGLSKREVNQLIKEHDRIYMLGHGAPQGLMNVGRFTDTYGFIIDHNTAELLKDKECIAIWCNADQYMKRYELKGLYSGMFISEVGEAAYCDLPDIPQSVVDESNKYFATWLGEQANQPLNEMYDQLATNYDTLAEWNPVAFYNVNRLYLVD
jgi:hypothetical protein